MNDSALHSSHQSLYLSHIMYHHFTHHFDIFNTHWSDHFILELTYHLPSIYRSFILFSSWVDSRQCNWSDRWNILRNSTYCTVLYCNLNADILIYFCDSFIFCPWSDLFRLDLMECRDWSEGDAESPYTVYGIPYKSRIPLLSCKIGFNTDDRTQLDSVTVARHVMSCHVRWCHQMEIEWRYCAVQKLHRTVNWRRVLEVRRKREEAVS